MPDDTNIHLSGDLRLNTDSLSMNTLRLEHSLTGYNDINIKLALDVSTALMSIENLIVRLLAERTVQSSEPSWVVEALREGSIVQLVTANAAIRPMGRVFSVGLDKVVLDVVDDPEITEKYGSGIPCRTTLPTNSVELIHTIDG